MNRKQKHNRLLVFDLELTCWEKEVINEDGSKSLDKSPPEGMENEIIQFGYVIIDMHKREIVEKDSWLVKPTKSEISEFCTKLTGISQEMIEKNGITFEKLRKILSKKGWKYIPCTSWGYGDIIQFREHCEKRNLESPLSRSFYCCKTLFGTWTGRSKGWGVKRALERLGLEFEGEQHDAMWDAYNTARILLNSIYKSKG
jgi:inhibitor of KinA sporulation pathway (predicted exonuclease)